jgi:hypothetical protein
MPLRSTFNLDLDVLFTKAEGVVTSSELHSHLDFRRVAGLLGIRELFDTSGATTSLSADEVRSLVSGLKALADRTVIARVAIVATDPVFYGIGRMVEALCQLQGGPEIAVFRTRDSGIGWLIAEI